MISSAALYRLSGLALLVGALLSIIVDIAEDLGTVPADLR
jgi:hypothetical protein